MKARRAVSASIALGLTVGAGTIGGSSGLAAQRSAQGLKPFLGKLRAEAGPCNRAPSTRRYVSTQGSDANPGTLRRPWKTLSRAFHSFVPGEAVYVRSGTYPEWAIESRSGTAKAPISLRAFPGGERPVLTGRLKIEGGYFCAAGLRFQGRTQANMNDVLIYVSGANHVEIRRNEILDASMSGIYVGDEGDSSRDVSIIGNYIHGNGTHDNLDHGVYFGHVNGGLIANNLVVANLALGLKIAPQANHALVAQNTVVDNGTAGVLIGSEANWSSNDNLVVNNIVAYNHEWGIRTYWEKLVGSGNLALRNLVFANGQGPFLFLRGGMVQQKSIIANPRFVSTGDLRLRGGSPAINRAIRAFSMSFDLTGRHRRSRPDLGAFEH
jgi:hypothetical protein